MELLLTSPSFTIKSKDLTLLEKNINLFEYSFSWEYAISHFFRNSIFIFDEEININDSFLSKTVIFYPFKRKTYVLEKSKSSSFLSRYFTNFKIISRQPIFYSFLIPMPEISYYLENSKLTWEDKFNIDIGRFNRKTYSNLHNYNVRLNSSTVYDFRENQFDPIFQRDFESIIEIANKYKEYLQIMLSIPNDQININNLIKPYYELSTEELKSIISIENSFIDEMHQEQVINNERCKNEQYEKFMNAEMDDLYGQAFENELDSIWNID